MQFPDYASKYFMMLSNCLDASKHTLLYIMLNSKYYYGKN